MTRTADPIDVRARLKRLLPDKHIIDLAAETGAVRRKRRIGIVPLVWALVLGFGTGRSRTIAGLRRAFEQATGTDVVASAFYDRFTPALAKLLRELSKSSSTASAARTSPCTGCSCRSRRSWWLTRR